uniref:Pyruvate dehydrogenase E1 component subunit alpha n=1 Tax=Schistocephalus solidus TaxID=70667 RepID=A0A0X3Q304_SCHSO
MLSALRNIRGRVLSVVESARVCQNFSSEPVAKVELHPYKLFKLDNGPSTEVSCSRSEALSYYETMQRVRRMETTISNLYKEKKVRGFCHLYSGQEAVAVGIEAALIPGDSIITAYRCHGFLVTRGESPASVIAELMGRKTGNVGGKGGSMHMYTKEFYGGNGIVGAQVPLGAGVALKHKMFGTNNVCVNLYGDGAANQGQVFETFNMAKLWNLPCIFICENNKYGMGTSTQRASANTAYYARGDYIPGIWVDGMDVLAVREAMRFATDWCRSGKGPILLEAETYRYYGHSMSDPGTSYRTRDEIQSVRRERDPIIVFGRFMTSSGLATDDDIKAIDKKIRQEIEKQLADCQAAPEPDVSWAFQHVYSKHPDNFTVRGCDLTKKYVPKD